MQRITKPVYVWNNMILTSSDAENLSDVISTHASETNETPTLSHLGLPLDKRPPMEIDAKKISYISQHIRNGLLHAMLTMKDEEFNEFTNGYRSILTDTDIADILGREIRAFFPDKMTPQHAPGTKIVDLCEQMRGKIPFPSPGRHLRLSTAGTIMHVALAESGHAKSIKIIILETILSARIAAIEFDILSQNAMRLGETFRRLILTDLGLEIDWID